LRREGLQAGMHRSQRDDKTSFDRGGHDNVVTLPD
jgi:hypothetical protein